MKHSTKLCRDSRHSILDSGWQVSIIQHPGSFLFLLLLFFSNLVQAQYKPTPENLKNREWFQDAKFGLFIHWGVYSVLGDGEWVMNVKQIPIKTYEKLPSFFNPTQFDPAAWVQMAKDAGMKYKNFRL